MAIPLVKEGKEMEYFGIEKCYFKCGNNTKFWHWRTNQPICKNCAKKHKVSEIEKSHDDYKPPTKEEYLKSIRNYE